jgi:hypothetical protein
VPDLTATNIALAPIAATLGAERNPRTVASAVGLCDAGEQMLVFTAFPAGGALPGTSPASFLVERISGDDALHMTRTDTWSLPVPAGYIRLRFDLLTPRAATPPLTISFVPEATAPNRIGWRLTWAIGDSPAMTGILLERVEGGQPVTVSSLVPVPFDAWVTVDMSFRSLDEARDIFTLTVFTADGSPRTALLVLDNGELTPFRAIAFNATIDSAPWVDNLLVCHQDNPLFQNRTPTPTP